MVLKAFAGFWPLAAAALFLQYGAFAAEVDGVAAKVGEETVLKSDVLLEMRRLNAPPSAYAEVRNQMVDRKLILKAAADAKVTMQAWIVEGRIREIVKKAFEGDRNKLMESLAKQKISYPEWHARMKEDMIVNAMRWNVVDKNATASPSAMRKEYESHPERYSVGAKTTVSVILLRPQDASKREAVSAALRTKDFADVARAFSVDSRAADGGVWKDVNPAEVFKPEVCEEIAKMPLHTLSRWIELDGWSFLLRKDAETRGVRRTFEEAYDEIEANVKEAEAKVAYEAWLERLRSETYIKIY